MTTNIFSYAAMHRESVAATLQTHLLRGLSRIEARRRLRTDGKNQLRATHVRWWRILLRQFRSPFIYLLIAAGVLALSLGEVWDALMIGFFLVVNTTLGFVQEFRSEKTLQLLKQYVTPTARVMRDAVECMVPREEIVRGDLLVVETGDQLSADVRWVDAKNLLMDESPLTGESIPIAKTTNILAETPMEMYAATNMGFAGTTVLSGRAMGIVCATGNATMFGNITTLAVTTQKTSAFEKELQKFSNVTMKIILVTLLMVFVANVLLKGGDGEIGRIILFSIALAVSVIPEGLPMVITFSLSRGALLLAKHKVIVRRLSAIEDLGRINVLCSDKTGTITENALRVTGVSPDAHDDATFFAYLASSLLGEEQREPFDIALRNALDVKNHTRAKKYERLHLFPFDPQVRWNAAVVRQEKNYSVLLRGAPDVIMEHCDVPRAMIATLNTWVKKQGLEGCRTLAIAQKKITQNIAATATHDMIGNMNDYTLLGIIAFVDPIKETTIPALERARELGVELKILTGDDPHVAGAVAANIGLISNPRDVVVGSIFFAQPPSEQQKLLNRTRVFARVTPEQKHRLLAMLKKEHVVGFLGEGINDAPALKIANVGLVVRSASDIAREVADIVLLENNLNVVVAGIEEGRKVFSNTVKYIKATFTSNFGHFYAIAIVTLFIPFLPMLPMQILLVNLLSDLPFLAIAADTVSKTETQRPQHYNIREIIMFSTLFGLASTADDFIFFGLFYRFGENVLQTNWFIGSILTELVFLYSVRSRISAFRATRPSTIIIALTLAAGIATVIIPLTFTGQHLFGFIKPQPVHLLTIGILVVLYFVICEILKYFYYRGGEIRTHDPLVPNQVR